MTGQVPVMAVCLMLWAAMMIAAWFLIGDDFPHPARPRKWASARKWASGRLARAQVIRIYHLRRVTRAAVMSAQVRKVCATIFITLCCHLRPGRAAGARMDLIEAGVQEARAKVDDVFTALAAMNSAPGPQPARRAGRHLSLVRLLQGAPSPRSRGPPGRRPKLPPGMRPVRS